MTINNINSKALLDLIMKSQEQLGMPTKGDAGTGPFISSGPTFTTGTSAPSTPTANDVWLDSSTGKSKIYDSGVHSWSEFYQHRVLDTARIPTKRFGRLEVDLKVLGELYDKDLELAALCEEQPGVKALYDQLQTAIRMYRE